MNMTYTKRKCWNVLEDIDDNIDALLKLQGTNTMQKQEMCFPVILC